MGDNTLSVKPVKVEEKPEKVEILIDLPPHSAALRIDGREYQHGMKYMIPAHAVASFKEHMGNAWRHEDEVRGQRKPFDMRHRSHTISAR